MVQVERYHCLWYQRGIRSICAGNFELCLEKSSLGDYLHSRAFHWENTDRSRNLSVFFRVWHWWADGTFHGIQSCQRSGSNLPCLSSKFQFFLATCFPCGRKLRQWYMTFLVCSKFNLFTEPDFRYLQSARKLVFYFSSFSQLPPPLEFQRRKQGQRQQ